MNLWPELGVKTRFGNDLRIRYEWRILALTGDSFYFTFYCEKDFQSLYINMIVYRL